MSKPSAYAAALSDYFHGSHDAAYEIIRDDGYTARIAASESFAGEPFEPIEAEALRLARGHVLDVGAGVGRHALVLQARGQAVTAIEVEPTLAETMHARGVKDARAEAFASLTAGSFDTILLLMNGFGLVGTPAGAVSFLQHARALLAPGGQLLCDSLDVSQTDDLQHLAYQRENIAAHRLPGQQRFCIAYAGARVEPFDWLHTAFADLQAIASTCDWSAEKLAEDGAQFLARLTPT